MDEAVRIGAWFESGVRTVVHSMPYYRLSSTGMSVWFLPQPQVQAGNVFALNQRVSGTKKKIKT